MIIQTQALTHRYGKFTAIEDVNLQVEQGEIFGFLGPNGAGKTTTIRTILDFIRPSEGAITVFGLDSRQDSVAIRRRIGYLPSELTLWENWTGVQYIHWLESVRKSRFLDEALRLADRLDYDLKRSLKGMSTGMRRKMGIIAALAHKPDLLILDEPTTGLDPLMQQAFHELMHEVRAEGRTVFLSSHNLPEVEHICNRVAIIRTGRVEAVETVSDLTHVAFRWLTLTFDQPATADGFIGMQGIRDIVTDGYDLRMRVNGSTDIDAVIKQAAAYTVRDLSIEQPTLEEIFLTYYGKKQEAEP
ncbi:MAG: ATP-binding cassette domain-containing protein [Anaerolineae bacterium]|nr:ATP-binding cassette domain-containing protein [Anaerolineae bacterium]